LITFLRPAGKRCGWRLAPLLGATCPHSPADRSGPL
jgi:hypothetical protein